METVTQNDLKEIKQMICELTKTQQKQFEKLDQNFNDLSVEIATLKEGQNSLNKRLDNLDFIARTIIGGVVLALIVGFVKVLYPELTI